MKNADKMKLIKEKYDAIMAKLEEERKKQEQEQARERERERGLMVVGEAYTPTSRSQGVASVTPKIDKTMLHQFVNQPFSSPNLNGNPERSTQTATPAKPQPKRKIDRRNQKDGDVEVEGEGDEKTPSKILFGTKTPMPSPQPSDSPPPLRDQRRNQENRSPKLLSSPLGASSPNPIQKKLNFTTTTNDHE